MYFLDLLEKLDDMKERSWSPLYFYLPFGHFICSLSKRLKITAPLVGLLPPFFLLPLYMVTSFYNNKDSDWLCQKVMSANTAFNTRNIFLFTEEVSIGILFGLMNKNRFSSVAARLHILLLIVCFVYKFLIIF